MRTPAHYQFSQYYECCFTFINFFHVAFAFSMRAIDFLRNELRRRFFNNLILSAGGLLRAAGIELVLAQCGSTLVQEIHSIETISKQHQPTSTSNAETKPTTRTTTKKQPHTQTTTQTWVLNALELHIHDTARVAITIALCVCGPDLFGPSVRNIFGCWVSLGGGSSAEGYEEKKAHPKP